MNYEELRNLMVESQLVPRGIKDKRVLDAMRRVPRHLFVGPSAAQMAYDDSALPIGDGQTISQPYMVAVMTELLELEGGEKVLEIGTGSGYQAAILAELAGEVYTVERVAALAETARERLRELYYDNVRVIIADGSLGLPEEAPFDRIVVTAASPDMPEPLLKQLSEGGIIIAPVGSRHSQQLLKIRKTAKGILQEYHTPCVFVPLIGTYGWKSEE